MNKDQLAAIRARVEKMSQFSRLSTAQQDRAALLAEVDRLMVERPCAECNSSLERLSVNYQCTGCNRFYTYHESDIAIIP